MPAAFLAFKFMCELPLVLFSADKVNLAVLPVVVLFSMVFSHAMRKGRSRATIEKTKVLTGLVGSIWLALMPAERNGKLKPLPMLRFMNSTE